MTSLKTPAPFLSPRAKRRAHGSLVVLFFLLLLSWTLPEKKNSISSEMHEDIQNQLQAIIKAQVQSYLPHSKNFQFKKVWTEEVSDKEIKAFISYSFDENHERGPASASVSIESQLTLNKSEEFREGKAVWNLNEVSPLQNEVYFKEGITIESTQ